MSKTLIYQNDSDIPLCNILCTSFIHNPSPMAPFSVKKHRLWDKSPKNPRNKGGAIHKTKRPPLSKGVKATMSKIFWGWRNFPCVDMFTFWKNKPQATNCGNWDDGMFFNVPKHIFLYKKRTVVHHQAPIFGGFVVFLACFSVEEFTKCLHENLWSSDKLHQATCTAVHGLRMVDHLNSWPNDKKVSQTKITKDKKWAFVDFKLFPGFKSFAMSSGLVKLSLLKCFCKETSKLKPPCWKCISQVPRKKHLRFIRLWRLHFMLPQSGTMVLTKHFVIQAQRDGTLNSSFSKRKIGWEMSIVFLDWKGTKTNLHQNTGLGS